MKQPQSPNSTRDARDWTRILHRYREPDNVRSIFEVLISAVPFVLLWILMWATGARVLIARTLEKAIQEVETPGLTAAVIDHALHDGITTSDVCAKLKELNILFIVYSGYYKLDGACASGELVQKPASPAMLLTALNGVLTQHRKSVQ